MTSQQWPDPWPTTDEEVRRWKLTDPYDRYFTNRANRVEQLFKENPESIDGLALVAIALGSLARFRFASEVPDKEYERDQKRFRLLVTQYCPSFVNRVSIPELVRHARKNPDHAVFEKTIKAKYPIHGFSLARQAALEDPLVEDFNAWADEQNPPLPRELRVYDYAGCIHRHYRNSVIHELRVASGRDPAHGLADEDDYPVFYQNYSGGKHPLEADPVEYMRFGVFPSYLLKLLREAIASLRQWSVDNDRDIFPEDE